MSDAEKTKSGGDNQFLTFSLSDQLFGIDILDVKEILEYGGITRIPLVPDYIRGVLNLRGNVVPVIDLKARFDWGTSEESKLTCIVIVEASADNETTELGIMVDAVNEVSNLSEDEIQATPNFGAKIRLDFISSIGKKDDKFVIILDVDNVLSIEELSQLNESLQTVAEKD